MSWINRQIAKIAPGYALKREVALRRLERLESLGNMKSNRRTFDAISKSRMRYDFLTTDASADRALQNTENLRYHVRRLEYNNGFIAGPIRRIVSNVVGQGFTLNAMVTEDEYADWEPFPRINAAIAARFNYQLEKNWKIWVKQADKRLILGYWELVAIAEGALLRDGEVLVIGRESARRDRMIPYCIEVLEIDRLQSPMSEVGNPRIRNGIRFDEEGAPISYFVRKEHPGETYVMGLKADDFDEIPAFNPDGTRKVHHLFNPVRPEQTRGFSQFAAGLKNMQDLERYEEAEIYARLEDACLTGIVKTTAPEQFQGGMTVGTVNDEDGEGSSQQLHEFAPGKWNYLAPGEDITIHNPQRSNQNMDVFTNHLLRGPANALDIPPEVLSQNWQGMNYSNARTVLLQFYKACRERQAYLVNHLCIPNLENVTRSLVARGKVQAPGFDRRPDAFLRHGWTLPGWQWVDPLKESSGKEKDVANNFDTITGVCAAQGKDIDEVLEVRAKELQRIQKLEAKYGVKFPTPKGTDSQPAQDQSGDEEDGDQPARSDIRRVK